MFQVSTHKISEVNFVRIYDRSYDIMHTPGSSSLM